MEIKKILETNLINLEGFHFSVFNLISILLILLIARLTSAIVSHVWKRRFKKQGLSDEGRKFAIITISKYLIYGLAFLLILSYSGIELAILVAGSSVLLVGIGFILKNLFIDIVSGMVIMFERTVEINDIVEVDSRVGRVKYIGLRATIVETRDGVEMIVPNGKFADGKVVNWRHGKHQIRFHIQVPVAYGSDPKLVAETLKDAAKHHPLLKGSSRGSTVWLTQFGETAMVFELLFWTEKTFPVENIISDLRIRIYRALKENGIHMPLPYKDMEIKIRNEHYIPSEKEKNRPE